jgi:hypothetical protein
MGLSKEDIQKQGEANVREILKTALHGFPSVISDEMKIEFLGAWFVFGYDYGEYPIALFGTEVEALRVVENQGYGNVVFWPFGKTWDEVKP